MKEILFRGKRIDNGEWVEGYYLYTEENTHPVIIDMECCSHIIIPETVGQFTGLTDKNGKRIFEGDIVRSTETSEIGIVQWFTEYSAFMVWCPVPNQVGFLYECSTIVEVVGNVHDNPELLKVE